nr:glycosyltransferase family 2 protein [uncultured Rhodopila sp.]
MTDESAKRFNPKLFEYDPAQVYPWRVFNRITVAAVTWNRLEHTRRFIDSVMRLSHLPYYLLIIDNGSTDETVPYLRQLAAAHPHVTILENRTNRGLVRGLLQIRDAVDDGLVIYCDNDMEVLSNYWLVLWQKAFHAVRLALGHADVVLAPRVVNRDEYRFRYAGRREILPIPAALNGEPRSCYATTSKDDPDLSARLREDVIVGWTDFLIGGVQAIPAHIFRRMRLEDAYPRFIGGTDSVQSSEYRRLGVRTGYIENGPVLRHNDWPYTEEKVRMYETLTKSRAVTDYAYIRGKLRDLARWR